MEKQYVQDSYSKIANEFDQTRYKPWPSVSNFVNSLDKASHILDAGCGNGRNMLIRNDVKWTGCDFCPAFVEICKKKGFNTIHADIRNLPFNDNEFDNVISIAVVHHISSEDERIKACQEFIRVTKSGGKILIQVWQFLGQNNSKFKQINNRDYFVTWGVNDHVIIDRYYHLFNEEDVDNLLAQLTGVKLLEKYIESNNWVFLLQKL